MTASKTGGSEPVVVIGVHSNEPLPLAKLLIELARRRTSTLVVLIFCLSDAPEMSIGVSLVALVHAWK